MSEDIFIKILLGIVGFVGALMVAQLIKIANAVQKIQINIGILANDHSNLKEDHKDLKKRVEKLEE